MKQFCINKLIALIKFNVCINNTFIGRNQEDVIPMTKQFVTQAVINGTFAVETFFFISGLIVVYVTVPMIKKINFTFHYFVMIRWLRLVSF